MPRIARVVIAGCAHHVTQRGNRQQDVFFCDADRRRYLDLLAEYSAKHGLAVQAYCLMRNHVHLIVVPREESSMGAALKPVHMRHTQQVNWTQGVTGRLWQGRFYSCPLDEQHLWTAVRYVERNPVRAGLVRRAEDWEWSSAAGHCGMRTDALAGDPCGLHRDVPPTKWAAWLAEPWGEVDNGRVEALRANTLTGRPVGGETFVRHLEHLVGRRLQALPRGRPINRDATALLKTQ